MHLFASKPTKSPLSIFALVIFKEPIDKNIFQCAESMFRLPSKRELLTFFNY